MRARTFLCSGGIKTRLATMSRPPKRHRDDEIEEGEIEAAPSSNEKTLRQEIRRPNIMDRNGYYHQGPPVGRIDVSYVPFNYPPPPQESHSDFRTIPNRRPNPPNSGPGVQIWRGVGARERRDNPVPPLSVPVPPPGPPPPYPPPPPSGPMRRNSSTSSTGYRDDVGGGGVWDHHRESYQNTWEPPRVREFSSTRSDHHHHYNNRDGRNWPDSARPAPFLRQESSGSDRGITIGETCINSFQRSSSERPSPIVSNNSFSAMKREVSDQPFAPVPPSDRHFHSSKDDVYRPIHSQKDSEARARKTAAAVAAAVAVVDQNVLSAKSVTTTKDEVVTKPMLAPLEPIKPVQPPDSPPYRSPVQKFSPPYRSDSLNIAPHSAQTPPAITTVVQPAPIVMDHIKPPVPPKPTTSVPLPPPHILPPEPPRPSLLPPEPPKPSPRASLGWGASLLTPSSSSFASTNDDQTSSETSSSSRPKLGWGQGLGTQDDAAERAKRLFGTPSDTKTSPSSPSNTDVPNTSAPSSQKTDIEKMNEENITKTENDQEKKKVLPNNQTNPWSRTDDPACLGPKISLKLDKIEHMEVSIGSSSSSKVLIGKKSPKQSTMSKDSVISKNKTQIEKKKEEDDEDEFVDTDDEEFFTESIEETKKKEVRTPIEVVPSKSPRLVKKKSIKSSDPSLSSLIQNDEVKGNTTKIINKKTSPRPSAASPSSSQKLQTTSSSLSVSATKTPTSKVISSSSTKTSTSKPTNTPHTKSQSENDVEMKDTSKMTSPPNTSPRGAKPTPTPTGKVVARTNKSAFKTPISSNTSHPPPPSSSSCPNPTTPMVNAETIAPSTMKKSSSTLYSSSHKKQSHPAPYTPSRLTELSASIYASLPTMGTVPVSITTNPLEVAAQVLTENSVRASLSQGRVVTLNQIWMQNLKHSSTSQINKEVNNEKEEEKKEDKTNENDVLYRRPCEAPGYAKREKEFSNKRKILLQVVRNRKLKVRREQAALCNKYEAARYNWNSSHEEEEDTSILKAHRSAVAAAEEARQQYGHPGVAARRARDRTAHNDGIARSDYEQEMILKELGREEALKRRIENGTIEMPNMKLACARFELPEYNDDGGNGLMDVLFEEANTRIERPWSDLEKCIFLDKFLQYPKQFSKIASFLTNKRVKDCVRFYYDSKKDIDYKGLLREHQQRRRGLKLFWEETISAAASMGAHLEVDEDQNVYFALPPDHHTFATMHRHPPHFPSSLKKNKRNSSSSFLSSASLLHQQDDLTDFVAPVLVSPPLPEGFKKSKQLISSSSSTSINSKVNSGQVNSNTKYGKKNDVSSSSSSSSTTNEDGTTPVVTKRTVQKWNQQEKDLFMQYFLEHGKDWPKITSVIPTKSEAQVKNYYQNYKSRLGLNEKRAQMLANANNPSTPSSTTTTASSTTMVTPVVPSSSSSTNGQLSVVSSLDAMQSDRKRKNMTSSRGSTSRSPPRSPHPSSDQHARNNNTSVSPFVIRNNRENELTRKAEMLRSSPHTQSNTSTISSLSTSNTPQVSSSTESSDQGEVNLSTLMSGAASNTSTTPSLGFMPDWLSADVDWRNTLPGMMGLGAMGLQSNTRGVLGLSDVALPYSALQHMYASPEQFHAAFAAQQQVLAHQQQAHARVLSQQQEGTATVANPPPQPTSSSSTDSTDPSKRLPRNKAAASPQQILNSLIQAQGMLQGMPPHTGFAQSLAQFKQSPSLANQNLANLRPRGGTALPDGNSKDSSETAIGRPCSPPTLSLSLSAPLPVLAVPVDTQEPSNIEENTISGGDVPLTSSGEHAFGTPQGLNNPPSKDTESCVIAASPLVSDVPLEASVTIPDKPKLEELPMPSPSGVE